MTRKSPPFSANDYPGETHEGNDGMMYTSVPVASGKYHRWVKAKSPAKKGKKSPAKKGKTCKTDQIRNPASGRCVSKMGAIGKKLLAGKRSSKKSPTKKTLCPAKITRATVILTLRDKTVTSRGTCVYSLKPRK